MTKQDNPKGLEVREMHGMCPVDPLYCSRFYDHECFNPDSYERAWVVWKGGRA